MTRRWLLTASAVLMLVAWVYLFGYPMLMGYFLARQCAKDGGTLNEAGTTCTLPVR